MNEKFPLLSTVSLLIRILGALVLFVGLYYAVQEGIMEPNQSGHSFGSEDAMQLGGGLLLTLVGLGAIAFGEIIGVLFAIESNTRETTKLLSPPSSTGSSRRSKAN